MQTNLATARHTRTLTFVVSSPSDQYRLLRVLFLFLAVALGAIYTWATRFVMSPDGVSYLDMGDAFFRGDWHMVINAYWSPLYSLLLGLSLHVFNPSSYWEFPVVHLVNFAIYLGALVCFDVFLHTLIRYQSRSSSKSESRDGVESVVVPQWAWLALGYTIFIWSSLFLLQLRIPTPDMCVAALVYLASAFILRIAMGATSWRTFALVGALLGLGYLTKAAMFPLAFVFMLVCLFAVGNLRRAVPLVLVALICFLVVASPWILALSNTKGRFTFGDSGKLNYAWWVNHTTAFAHWQGENPGGGTPRHPPSKIHEAPAVYAFATPIGGTYPVWYDPSYWYEGVVTHFDLKEQTFTLAREAVAYLNLFFRRDDTALLQGGLLAGVLILYLMGRGRWLGIKDLVGQWILLVPAIAAMLVYALVHLEGRYIAPFVVIFWMGVLAGVRLPYSDGSRRLVARVSIGVVLVMMASIAASTALSNYLNWQDAFSSRQVQWQIANSLNQLGIQPGDKVAFIGYSFYAYWPRLARVQIVAEIPEIPGQQGEAYKYWASGSSVQYETMKTLAGTGAKVVVTKIPDDVVPPAGWQRLGDTDHYVYMLSGLVRTAWPKSAWSQ